MPTWLRTPVVRPRATLVVLTLVSHLFATLGFPLPSPTRATSKESGRPFPCQSRPCGCRTYDECWAGDCCCFTLEEKLAWAAENGIEPPPHVRPLIEAREARLPHKKKSCCCSVADSGGAAAPAEAGCNPKRDSNVPRGRLPSRPEEQGSGNCTDCTDESSPTCRSEPNPCHARGPVCWVVGVFAQECRGVGPAGLFQVGPTTIVDCDSRLLPAPRPSGQIVDESDRAVFTPQCPPVPPPRPA